MADYIEKKVLQEEFRKRKTMSPDEPLSDEIGLAFLMITKNFAKSRSFFYLSQDVKDDMISHALVHMVKYANSFDCDKYSDPFSYFTQVTKNAFFQVLNKMKLDVMKEKRLYLETVPDITVNESGFNEDFFEDVVIRKKNKVTKKRKTNRKELS